MSCSIIRSSPFSRLPCAAVITSMPDVIRAAIVAALLWPASGLAATPAAVTVNGTALEIPGLDGRAIAQADLAGHAFAIGDQAVLTVRIEAVEFAAHDPSITLYTLAARQADGGWAPMCPVGIDGTRRAMALGGYWTADGRHLADSDRFNLTCTAGAVGKCVLWGYKPWLSAAMWEAHQACVRMTRADYCGDGHPHTRDGTPIDLWDRFGVNQPARPPMLSFEAAWDSNGAVCVAHTRIPEIVRTDALPALCPARLAGRVGSACTEQTVPGFGTTLLMNGS